MRRLALVVLSTALAMAAAWGGAEAFYRLRYPPSHSYASDLVPDGELGWNSVPPIRTLPLNGRAGAGVVYLGDSFTQTAQWPDEAQRLLHEQGIATDGFNLGVSGFGTTQEMLKLRRHIAALNPRVIVLLFFAWNDLRDNYPYPEIYYGPQRTSRPYLVVANGRTSVTRVRWSSSIEAGLLHSEAYLRLVNRASLGLNAAVVSRWPDLPSTLGWRARLYYEHAASWQPFYRPSQSNVAFVKGAYDSTIEAFRQIRVLAEAARATVLVIGIDNAFTVDADDARHVLAPNPDLDPSLPMRRMAALLGAEDISFINAQPELAALGQTLGRDVYNGPAGGLAGHLGPEGDRLIGAIAARWLATYLESP